MFSQAYDPDFPINAKTGTVAYEDNAQNLAMDMWMVGYNLNTTFAVWYGYDEPQKEGNELLEDEMYTKKADLFKKLNHLLNEGKPKTTWEQPETVTETANGYIQSDFGLIANTKNPILSTLYPELDPYYLGVDNWSRASVILDNQPIIPKDYQIGQWKTTLEDEKAQYLEKEKTVIEQNQRILEQLKRQYQAPQETTTEAGEE